jgi:hypothetical protein
VRNGFTVSPGGNFVWGFQVFAHNRSSIPSIVIRLRDVTLICGTQKSNPQFVTINRFRQSRDKKLTGIDAGYVYQIAIAFDENDISPDPNSNAMEVAAHKKRKKQL